MLKKALLVIDIQNDYFPSGAFPLEGASEASDRAVASVQKARSEGWLIVGIQHVATAEAPFFRPDTEGVRIHPDIKEVLDGAPVIRKSQADSFFDTGLEELLRGRGVTDIYLVGMMTQHCVTHTALSPQARGMKVHIISEACAAPTRILHNLALNGLAAYCHIV